MGLQVVPLGRERPVSRTARRGLSLARPPFLAVLIGMLVAQGLVVTALMSRSFLFFEDFSSLVMFEGQPLSVDLLTRSVFGHLAPAFVLTNRYVGHFVGADWAGLTAITVVAQLAGTVAFARLLVALHGRRWWVLWLTGAYAFSIVNLNNAPWWGATVIPQIPTALCVSAFGCAVRFGTTGRVRHLMSFTLVFAAALGFWEKSLVLPAYLGLFVLLVGLRSTDGTRARLRTVLRMWPIWLAAAALGLADLYVYLRGGYVAEAGVAPPATSVGAFVLRSLSEGVLPSLHGFDFPNVTLPGPDGLTVLAVCLSALVVVVVTCWRSSRGVRVWVWFVVAFAIGQVLVGRGRLNLMGVDLAAHELRYQVDAVYLALVALSVAASGAPLVTARRRWARAAALLVPIVLLAPWVLSVRYISDHSWGLGSRTFFSGMRATDAPDRYLDVAVPAWVVPPQMYPWNMAGQIYPLVRPGATTSTNPDGTFVLTYDGRVVPTDLRPVAVVRAGTLCLDPGQTERIDVSGDRAPRSGLVEAEYRGAAGAELRVDAEGVRDMGGSTAVSAGAALPDDATRVVVPLPTSDFATLALTNSGAVSTCLSDVRFVVPTG